MAELIASKLPLDDLDLDQLGMVSDVIARQAPVVPMKIPIRFELTSMDGIRKRVRVTPGMKGYSVFELCSDEGTSIPPGTDSARPRWTTSPRAWRYAWAAT